MENRKPPYDGNQSPLQKNMHPNSTSQVTGTLPTGSVAPSSETIHRNQQTRRLQLRNAGFRGQKIPVRRISPILGSPGLSSESFCRVVSNENSPHNLEKRQLFGEDVPPNPVNILQELQNSARRIRHPPRRSIGSIFQDDTATAVADADSGTSCLSESSNIHTPQASRTPSTLVMKHMEVPSNGRTPPSQVSPLAIQSRNRNGKRMKQRSTSGEAAKYIEHLESQLVAVNTKLDSLMSPTSHKARAAKLRALTTEARSLRQQLSDWEQNFNEKVREERQQLAVVEMSLTHRLQALEDEVESKDNKVKDLEWEIGNLRTRVKHAEGLEAVNTDLERRIDLLTNLLVQSPTKLDLCSATSSPSKPGPYRQYTRPRSMLPRVPPSPGSIHLSLNTGSDAQFRRPRRSVASASSTSQSPDTMSACAVDRALFQSTESRKESKDLSVSEYGISSSFRSPPSSSSRPTSMYSSGSLGAYSWGLPLPPEVDLYGKANHKQRRMRRFPSGAACLKPLILPTAACTPSLPASAPVQDTFQSLLHREFSDVLVDPLGVFPSRYESSSPITTPTQPSRRRSASAAQTEALSTLEGQYNRSKDEDDSHSVLSPRSCMDEPLETVEEETSEIRSAKRERPRSLNEELAEVGLLLRDSFDDGLIPYANHGRDQSIATEAFETRAGISQLQTPSRPHRTVESTRAEVRPHIQAKSWKRATLSPKPVAATTIASPQAHGLFSRLKCLVSRTRLGPSRLARRLIYNAWVVGLARLGGLGWWLLGLVYRTRWQEKKQATDAKPAVEEVPTQGMQWHELTSSTDEPGRIAEGSDRCLAQNVYKDESTSAALAMSTSQQRHKKPTALKSGSTSLPCPACQEPPTRRSFRLWLRFSLAIVLAVGIAIKEGPETLFEGCQNEKLYKTMQSSPYTLESSAVGIAQASRSGSSALSAENEAKLH
ncbi:MAG: hypothetical protein Q9185_003454 [Variospora sp. 1 TL-2023]